MGGFASRQAATRVKPEQASKVKSRGPTGLHNREGSWNLREHPTSERTFPRRGKGRGTPAQHTGQHGRSHAARRRESRCIVGVEPRRKSEGLIVPMASRGQHNHERGKDLWFETCLTEFRSRREGRACDLLCAPETPRGAGLHGQAGAGRASACREVTLVREPDAEPPPVRFVERRWETPDRCGWR